MHDFKAYLKNKKITILGLGLLGRGVGDAEFLAQSSAELIVTDLKSAKELAPSIERLKKFPKITYRFGEHALEDFEGRDFILKAAGVPDDSPYLMHARKRGIPIKMSASWFAELSGVKVVGVTGTRGKSSVTFILRDILEAAGVPFVLGGNIRGVSTLALLPEATKDSIALMELDSWQLQGFGESKLSPHVAVFTTFYPDHMNYYFRASEGNSKTSFDTFKGTMKAISAYHEAMAHYLEDKAQVFLHQKPGDTFVLGAQAKDAVLGSYAPLVTPIIADTPLVEGWELSVLGEHNRYNAACATLAAKALGIDEATCRKALADFKGVSGRLELVREVNGVKFYNDTTATTPEATVAALSALNPDKKKSVILIMGGADKGLDMSALMPLAQKTKKVILLAGTGTEKIKYNFPDAPVFDSLKAAVANAKASATAGDIVLFSPAFASFGMFQNEFDRGDQFMAIVDTLE